MAEELLTNIWDIWVETAPWLVLGLLVAGLLKACLSTRGLHRWLGGHGVLPPLKAAILGTPLPLCSCSVLPAAIQLRRSGASRGTTVSFLIATPENGADSLAVSYVLLGPLMTAVRLFSALISAISAGLLTEWLAPPRRTKGPENMALFDGGPCCNEGGCDGPASSGNSDRDKPGLLSSLRYAFTDLLGDIAPWLVIGIVAAGLVRTAVPADFMAEWGSGLTAMLAMLLLSIPMYVCATASTPLAASLILSGVSPGTALVFLLAGPATNLSSAALVKRELGRRALAGYLSGVIGMSLALGLSLDWFLAFGGIDLTARPTEVPEVIPEWTSLAAAVVLAILVTRFLGTTAWRTCGRLRQRISMTIAEKATPSWTRFEEVEE